MKTYVGTAYLALFCASVALITCRPAVGQVDYYYPSGAYTVDTPMVGNVAFVGEDQNGYTSDPNTGDPYVANVTVATTGTLPGTAVYGTSSVTLSGGDLYGGLDTFNSSSATINTGTIEVECIADDSSTININGGTLAGNVQADETSTVTISSGLLQSSAQARDSGNLIISGGTIYYAGASGEGNVTISGGVFTDTVDYDKFEDDTTGTFTFEGTGLSATDLGHNNMGEAYSLSGTLADGDSVTGDVIEVFTGAAGFTLDNVPEPASLATLGICGMALLRRPRTGARKS